MITDSTLLCQSLEPLPWQTELQQLITEPAELWDFLALPKELLTQAEDAVRLFPLRAPRPYLSRIKLGDLDDPLLRQILPLGIETHPVLGFNKDPLQEKQANQKPGLLHKYHGRVLLIAASTCAINCRFCFRRHFPYQENNPGRLGWQQSLRYIAADPSIAEVILSGGDPLMQNDATIEWFYEQLAAISHVKTIRFHTRLPIVIPQRITSSLIKAMTQTRLKTIIVLHCNHAQEIDNAVWEACQTLKTAGIILLNQSVLLRGVNDDVTTLTQLSQELWNADVLPYYLHVCDRVSGTAHFLVEDPKAIQLHQQLQSQLPGYLVPRLVRELAGALSKQPLVSE